jgi:hypothetical protein
MANEAQASNHFRRGGSASIENICERPDSFECQFPLLSGKGPKQIVGHEKVGGVAVRCAFWRKRITRSKFFDATSEALASMMMTTL